MTPYAFPDQPFIASLELIRKAASDERNFVKKGVSWALRSVGHRSPATHAAAIETGQRLAASANPTERWIGKDALRDLTRPLVVNRIKRR